MKSQATARVVTTYSPALTSSIGIEPSNMSLYRCCSKEAIVKLNSLITNVLKLFTVKSLIDICLEKNVYNFKSMSITILLSILIYTNANIVITVYTIYNSIFL